MGRRFVAVICDKCHKPTDKQVKPGVFHCEVCGLIYDEASIEGHARMLAQHRHEKFNVQFSDKDL